MFNLKKVQSGSKEVLWASKHLFYSNERAPPPTLCPEMKRPGTERVPKSFKVRPSPPPDVDYASTLCTAEFNVFTWILISDKRRAKVVKTQVYSRVSEDVARF